MTIDRSRAAPAAHPVRRVLRLFGAAWAALAIFAGCTAPLPDDPTTWETDWVQIRSDRGAGRLQDDIDRCKAEATTYEDDNRAKDPGARFVKCMEALGWERERPFGKPVRMASAQDPQPAASAAAASGAAASRSGVGASGLKEDPALACYRSVRSRVVDGRGVAHNETLYAQLGLAAGIGSATLAPAGNAPAAAGDTAYDCAGAFYDGKGTRIAPPAYPARAGADSDVKAWKARVLSFFTGASVEPKKRRTLPLGKALLCTRWAEVSARASPDPSLLKALEVLQQSGGEAPSRPDRVWLTRIVTEATAKGCPSPALPAGHEFDSWVLPAPKARAFLREFRDCSKPDANQVGGCPHPFDVPHGPGNHVNARYILDAKTVRGDASWIVGDATANRSE